MREAQVWVSTAKVKCWPPFQLWGWVGKGISEVRNTWLIALLEESQDSVFSHGKMAQTGGMPQSLRVPRNTTDSQ